MLLLGGLPIREPIVHYGPFVMNTKSEIADAIDDFNAGRMGTIPAIALGLTGKALTQRRERRKAQVRVTGEPGGVGKRLPATAR